MKATDGTDYEVMTDPTEAELYRAFGNDLIEKICKSLRVYEQKDRKIPIKMALRVIRSFKE